MTATGSVPRTLVLLIAVAVAGGGVTGTPRRAEAAEGRLLQSVASLPLEEGPALWAALEDGRVLVEPNENEIRAIDLATGLVRWRYASPGVRIRSVERRPRQLVVIAKDLQLVSLEDGTVDWTYPLGCRADGTCQLTPIRIEGQRALLMGFDTAPNSLMVVDLVARDESWPSWVNVGPIGRVDADTAVVMVSSADGKSVSALDPGMGRLLWKVDLPRDGSSGTAPPQRMWADDTHAYVWRALPNGAAPSRIDVLARDSGRLVRTVFSVTCSGALADCGAIPAHHSGVVWNAPRAIAPGARPRVGHVLVHDFKTFGTPVDTQVYLAAPPVVAIERLVVFADRRRDRVHIEARRLPDGAQAWEKTMPPPASTAGSAASVRLGVTGGAVDVLWPGAGLITGLSLGDGAVTRFGLIDTEGQPVRNVFLDGEALLLSTGKRLHALRATPLAELVGELRRAFAAGDVRGALTLDGVLLRVADQFEEAAAAHGVVIRHALLAATRAVKAGGGANDLDAARQQLAVTPGTSARPLVDFAVGMNNLLVDLIFERPGGIPDGTAGALQGLAETYADRLERVGAAVGALAPEDRARLRAAGLHLVEALTRADRASAATPLVAALAGAPLDVDADALPAPVRRVAGRAAASLADTAVQEARARRVDAAVERLTEALALPFVDAVVPRHDPSRLQIQVWRDGLESPKRREVAALAKEAAAAWGTLGAGQPTGELECLEACQRRRVTCERPCVEKDACDALLKSCNESCERTTRPSWPAPKTTVPREDPTYPQKCL